MIHFLKKSPPSQDKSYLCAMLSTGAMNLLVEENILFLCIDIFKISPYYLEIGISLSEKYKFVDSLRKGYSNLARFQEMELLESNDMRPVYYLKKPSIKHPESYDGSTGVLYVPILKCNSIKIDKICD
jgi:hypothetical protein